MPFEVRQSAWLAWVVCAALSASPVRAERQHTVLPGQSLEVIARRYKIKSSALAAANGISKPEGLRNGQVLIVPPEGVVYVTSGQTLSSIAHAHKLGALALAKANHLEPDATLRIGQRLLLPGYQPSKREVAGEKRWGKPKQRGVVTMYRIWSGESLSVRLVDTRGRTRSGALQQLREFLRPRESKKRKTPNARLLSLLAQVSDHFGGRPLHIVSGFRLPGGFTRDTSRHVAGEAIDFRIPGVPLTVLRDYCAHFENVGVGYYPRTQFVHLDVRRQAGRWTDWSGAGQAPLLMKPSEDDGASAPIPRSEAEIPEPPPAPDDGQPPAEIPGAEGQHKPK